MEEDRKEGAGRKGEGRLTESGTPHHRWWGGRHPFIRSLVIAVVRASLRAYRCGWCGSGGVGVRCSRGVGTRFCQWNGGGGGVWVCYPRSCRWWSWVTSLSAFIVCVGIGSWPRSSFVVRAWFFVCLLFEGDVAPACCVKKGEGKQNMRETAHLIDSDDEMCRHRLDDVARPLTCQVVTSIAIPRPWGWGCCRARVVKWLQ